MATYKQKLPRVHHVPSDTEELSGSEQEWVMFNSPKPIERRLVNNISDEEWSPVEASVESNSEFASVCSECDSEPYYVQDRTGEEGQDNFPLFTRNMPSHDGTGNFFDTTLSDGSNYDTSTSHIDTLRYHDQDNESLSSDMKGSVISDETSKDQRNSIKESWIAKLRNVFRIDVSAINCQEQTIQIYHKFAESVSSAARFELGDLEHTNPIISYTNFDFGNENASNTYTTVTTRLIVPKDPMSINFPPTISKDMLNEMITTEDVNSADQNQQSSSRSVLSMVWTAFCRIANIVSDDTDSDSSNLTLTSSNHNAHSTGLASIIAENHHTYFPFGNHLTLSEHSHNYYSSSPYSSSSTPSKILLTPVSSSTSLKSFTSRAGSDCGLESGRGMGENTNLGATLVL